MKRKKIEAIEPLPLIEKPPRICAGKEYIATAQVVKVDKEDILIIDIYFNKKPVKAFRRIVLSQKDYANYNFKNKSWDGRKIGYEINEKEIEFRENTLYFSDAVSEIIKKYTEKLDNPYCRCTTAERIESYQSTINYKKITRREKTKYLKLKQRSANLPKIPRGFGNWIKNEILNVHYLFYKRKGDKVHVNCSNCNKKYSYRVKNSTGSFEAEYENWGEIPKHNNKGKCKYCETEGIWKSAGKQNSINLSTNTSLIQKYLDAGIVIRHFYSKKIIIFDKKEMESRECIESTETIRSYFIKEKPVIIDYHKFSGFTGCAFWDYKNFGGLSNIHIPDDAYCYPGSALALKDSEFEYSAIDIYEKKFSKVNIVNYFKVYRKFPALEMLLKMKLYKLAEEIVKAAGYELSHINYQGKSAQEVLMIRKSDLNYLIKYEGERRRLIELQFESEKNIVLKDKVRDWLNTISISFSKLEKVFDYVKPEQVINRAIRYSEVDLSIDYEDLCADNLCLYAIENIRQKADRYLDYLSMSIDLNFEMNSINIYPKNLEAAHQKVVLIANKEKTKKKIIEKNNEFPEIKKIYRRLMKKYKYETDEYIIRPASSAGEIIEEGNILHHCVGGNHYLKYHNEEKTIILFMRYKESKDVPFVTIEISTNDNRILQWYGYNDKKPDAEKIDVLLKEYVKQLNNSKKLEKSA